MTDTEHSGSYERMGDAWLTNNESISNCLCAIILIIINTIIL